METRKYSKTVVALLLAAAVGHATAETLIYDEASRGDLAPWYTAAPTLLDVVDGTNVVRGSVYKAKYEYNTDEDSFIFRIPAGYLLTSLNLRLNSSALPDGNDLSGGIGLYSGMPIPGSPEIQPDANGWPMFPTPLDSVAWEMPSGSSIVELANSYVGNQIYGIYVSPGSYTPRPSGTGGGEVAYEMRFTVSTVPEGTAASLFAWGLIGVIVVAIKRSTNKYCVSF